MRHGLASLPGRTAALPIGKKAAQVARGTVLRSALPCYILSKCVRHVVRVRHSLAVLGCARREIQARRDRRRPCKLRLQTALVNSA